MDNGLVTCFSGGHPVVLGQGVPVAWPLFCIVSTKEKAIYKEASDDSFVLRDSSDTLPCRRGRNGASTCRGQTGDRPPATQQPAGQPPAGQQPSTRARPTTSSPASQQPSSTIRAGNKIKCNVGCVKPGTSTGTWVLENAEAQKAGATGSGAVGTSGGSTMTFAKFLRCRDSEFEGACEPQGRDCGNDVKRVWCHRSRRSTGRRSSGRSDGCDGWNGKSGHARSRGCDGSHRRNRSRRRASFRASLQCGIVEDGFATCP